MPPIPGSSRKEVPLDKKLVVLRRYRNGENLSHLERDTGYSRKQIRYCISKEAQYLTTPAKQIRKRISGAGTKPQFPKLEDRLMIWFREEHEKKHQAAMADSSQDLTSANSRMFLEKMALLNKTFVGVLQGHLRKVHDVDLSPTVKDYLSHVANLDKIYGGPNGSSRKAPSAFAFGGANGASSHENVSSSTCSNAPKVDSSASKLDSSSTVGSTISFGTSNTSSANTDSAQNERRGTKRAKRGGPDEKVREVMISQVVPSAPSTDTTPASKSLFSFGKAQGEGNKDAGGDKAPAKPLFAFGAPPKDALESQKDSVKDSFKASSGTDKSPLFAFGKTTPKDGASDGEKKASTFTTPAFPSVGTLSGAGTKPLFSFGSTNKDPLGTTPPATAGFKFGPPPTSNSGTESGNKDDGEEEYVPPKTEAVVEDEPGAVFSTKCSVFVLKGKAYEKLGVGQLHIKENEAADKKILLVRAATTIGSIWLNALADKNLKCTKADDVKLRVNSVNDGHPVTHLIRLPSKEDRERVEKELAQDGEE